VKNVQAEDHLGTAAVFQPDVAAIPKMIPLQHVALDQFVEPPRLAHGLRRIQGGFGDGEVSGGVKGNDLFDLHRFLLRRLDKKLPADVSGLFDNLLFHFDLFLAGIRPDSGGLG
jgi:hypothetical protein